MGPGLASRRSADLSAKLQYVYRFFTESTYSRRRNEPGSSDLAVGNPHEMPLPEFVDALRRWSVPQNEAWFGYKDNTFEACRVVADSLQKRRGMPFKPEDIFLTNGAFAALAVVLGTIVDPDDEVIFISPPWFFYEALIASAMATPVRVRIDPRTRDLDIDAIARAITPKTRALILNSPHNPTGRVYEPELLRELSRILDVASERNGRTIYLLSDEAYSRILFDGREYHSPGEYYPPTFVLYTYGKTLLTPGQRIGYVAMPPTMPHREELRGALYISQLVTGFAFPNALLQHAIGDLEALTIDVAHLQVKRDGMVSALRGMGYQVNVPEGTFYLMVRSPWADDWAFVEALAAEKVFCLPGVVVEMPGYFRISLTANDQMIERALPIFAAARQWKEEAAVAVPV